jgi:hypothetical protein
MKVSNLELRRNRSLDVDLLLLEMQRTEASASPIFHCKSMEGLWRASCAFMSMAIRAF